MDYDFIMIILLCVLVFALLVTMILAWIRVNKNVTNLNNSKVITECLSDVSAELDVVRRTSLTKDKNIATLKNTMNSIASMQAASLYQSQLLAIRQSWNNLAIYTEILSRIRNLSATSSQSILYKQILSLVQETETISSQIKNDNMLAAIERRRMLESVKTRYSGVAISIINKAILHVDSNLQKVLDRLQEIVPK